MKETWLKTEIGPIHIAEENGKIVACGFCQTVGEKQESSPILEEAKKQMQEYFAGKREQFSLPLQTKGTAFQESVWQELQKIPYGTSISYCELAQRIGNPKAARAVGMANHHNPIGIIIPCHRVIGKNGKLIGYAGGMDKKEYLLEFEKRVEKKKKVR